MTHPKLDRTVSVARAIGHPARLRTLAMLRTGELCVCQITAVLELAASTVSAHLRELRRAGLLVERKDGRWVHVELSEDAAARPWIDTALASLGEDPQLAADDVIVRELRGLALEDLCRLGLAEAKKRTARRS